MFAGGCDSSDFVRSGLGAAGWVPPHSFALRALVLVGYEGRPMCVLLDWRVAFCSLSVVCG